MRMLQSRVLPEVAVIAVGLILEGIVFAFLPRHSDLEFLLSLLVAMQLIILAGLLIFRKIVILRQGRYVTLLESAFTKLDPALAILFDALVAGQRLSRETAGRHAYLEWKASYVQKLGISTIIRAARKGELPMPMRGLVIPAGMRNQIRTITLDATSATR
jgi:hypothetical protein